MPFWLWRRALGGKGEYDGPWLAWEGKGAGREAGEPASGAEFGPGWIEGPWKSFAMLLLSIFVTADCAEVGGTAATWEVEVGVAEMGGGRLVTADFAVSDPPFWTATEPKDLTTSAGLTAGTADGEEEIGATASSIEPNVTGDPW